MTTRFGIRASVFTSLAALVVAACSAAPRSDFSDRQQGSSPGGASGPGGIGSAPTLAAGATAPVPASAFFDNDPPQKWCGPASEAAAAPPAPGGTAACPDDKNVEGCPCAALGTTAACWPGKRANRNHGVCVDGKTTCTGSGETGGKWGPCDGAVLPDPTVKYGPGACSCFSKGTWNLANTGTCTDNDSTGTMVLAVSSAVPDGTSFTCPDADPATIAAESMARVWSSNAITSDCAGHFKLCYTIKAGNMAMPGPGDCTIATSCVETDYPKAGVMLKLPDLPGWASTDAACIARFSDGGGFAEMSVIGKSFGCDTIDDGSGAPFVFDRSAYCPPKCASGTSTDPVCKECVNGANQMF